MTSPGIPGWQSGEQIQYQKFSPEQELRLFCMSLILYGYLAGACAWRQRPVAVWKNFPGIFFRPSLFVNQAFAFLIYRRE